MSSTGTAGCKGDNGDPPSSADKIKGEIKWIDAWIRWERRESFDDDDEDEIDPDQLENQEIFHFSFPTDKGAKHEVKLWGFPSDSQEAWCSTGLTPWKSARYLCEHLVQTPDVLLNKRILECGSGLGLCGILAHSLTKTMSSSGRDSTVVLTDGDTDTLRQLRANIQKNAGDSTTIACRQLLWGAEHVELFQRENGAQKFDIILGSDLIYVRSVVEPLLETVSGLLAPKGTFLMAYCARETMDLSRVVTLKDILDVADNKGFKVECLKETDDGIYVHAFQRRDGEALLVGEGEG